MPTASDYVSGPFGPGKIYQKQPAVSSATCGIRPAALHYYVMRYDEKCSCHYLFIICYYLLSVIICHSLPQSSYRTRRSFCPGSVPRSSAPLFGTFLFAVVPDPLFAALDADAADSILF